MRVHIGGHADWPINVIASAAKQSISQRRRDERWIASSQVLLAMTWLDPDSNFKQQIRVGISRRDAPEVCVSMSLKQEGAGNAGCALHPRSRVQRVEKKTHTSIQGSGGDPTFPAQWLYGLYRALPGESGFVVSVASRNLVPRPGRAFAPPQDLTPTTEASGPHDFAVRFSIVRPARRCPLTETALRTNFTPDTAASTTSHPNVR
jgi:hypothetical protein